MTTTTLVTLALLSGSMAVAADERPKKPLTPLRLQVVFSRHMGDKKVASHPYTLALNAGEGRTPAKIRMGINVPLKYEGKETPGNVIYKNVGSNVDCRADSLDDERYRVYCTLEQSSLYGGEGGAALASADPNAPPMMRSFNVETDLLLKDGQTAQLVAATDPVTGEVIKVDVTLSVVR